MNGLTRDEATRRRADEPTTGEPYPVEKRFDRLPGDGGRENNGFTNDR